MLPSMTTQTISRRRRGLRILCTAAGLALMGAFPALADAHPAPQPLISQVFGGGGNIGAPYQNDFIVVFNRSGAAVDLTGYSVQYAPAASANWTVTPLSGSLEIGQYLLVAEGNAGGTAGAPLPAADARGNTTLSVSAGKVALVSSFTPLTEACPGGPAVIDLVGYGSTANCYQGTRAPTKGNPNSLQRKGVGCVATANNGADFAVGTPQPRNRSSARNLCAPIPAVPTLSSSSPTTPGNSTTPRIIGDAPAGSTVELYPDAACSGAPAATGSAAQLASPGIAVTVASESTTTFHALAFDANNTSSCSTTSVTYVEDSGVPSPPTLHASDPASPSNDPAPRLKGSAEAGSTVRIYSDATCTTLAASGPASQFIEPGILTPVASNSTTTFHATATDAAGNVSACSPGSLTYVEDSTGPAEPTFTSSSPTSPGSDTMPLIRGDAEAGSTVRLYTDAACTEPVASGSAAEFPAGLTVVVPANSTTSFYATARDSAGTTSACSTGDFTYVEDSTAPAEPTFTSSSPVSPGSDTTPLIRGSAEAGSTVRLYTDAACTEPAGDGTAARFSSSGIVVSVAANSTTTFHATAVDAVGNVSRCSTGAVTYTQAAATAPSEPLRAPSEPLTSPPSGTAKRSRLTISHLRVTPVVLLAGSSSTPVGAVAAASRAVGAAIRLSLSEPATVTFTILREPRRRQRPGRLGSPAHDLHRRLGGGANSVPFSGRLGNRIFPPGVYRLYAVATDAAGRRSNRASVGFRIAEGR